MTAATTGKVAEALACNYLQSHGLSVKGRNYRSRHGEIDLIMGDSDSLVFVEVRYRRQPGFGSGAESVDHRKRLRIVACAQHYLQKHPRAAGRPCRFDVVAISGNPAQPEFEWIRDAFSALL